MWNLFYSLSKSRVIWLMSQAFVLFICAGYIQHVYRTNILPDKEVGDIFQQTQCFLIRKELSTKGHLVQRYRADFLVSYNANGVQYNRWVSGNGLDRGFIKNEAEQEDILSQFEVGGSYPCLFHPESPYRVVLTMRRNWFSTFPLVVPLAVGMVVFYYFLKILYRVIDSSMKRSYKRRKKI